MFLNSALCWQNNLIMYKLNRFCMIAWWSTQRCFFDMVQFTCRWCECTRNHPGWGEAPRTSPRRGSPARRATLFQAELCSSACYSVTEELRWNTAWKSVIPAALMAQSSSSVAGVLNTVTSLSSRYVAVEMATHSRAWIPPSVTLHDVTWHS